MDFTWNIFGQCLCDEQSFSFASPKPKKPLSVFDRMTDGTLCQPSFLLLSQSVTCQRTVNMGVQTWMSDRFFFMLIRWYLQSGCRALYATWNDYGNDNNKNNRKSSLDKKKKIVSNNLMTYNYKINTRTQKTVVTISTGTKKKLKRKLIEKIRCDWNSITVNWLVVGWNSTTQKRNIYIRYKSYYTTGL